MQPSRTRLRDATVVAALLAALLAAGRLTATSLRPEPGSQPGPPTGERAVAGRTVPLPPATQAHRHAPPRTLPVVAEVPLPGRPGSRRGPWRGEGNAVAAGRGAVWIADGCGVWRIDPRTNRVTARVAIPGRDPGVDPCRVDGLSVGGDGSLWAATSAALVRIDRSGRRVAATLPVAPSGPPAAAAGAVWVPCCRVARSEDASLPPRGWLLRVDPATDRVTARIPLAGGHPNGVGAGRGAIWVAGYRDRQDRPAGVIGHAPRVWRVDPATNRVAGPVSPPGSPIPLGGGDATPPSVLAGNDVVFMSDPPTGVVWRVDARRPRFMGSVTVVQGGPLATAAGIVWAAGASGLTPLTGPDAGGDGPRLPGPPGRWITGMAAGADAVWVATPDVLYRVDPRGLERGRGHAVRAGS